MYVIKWLDKNFEILVMAILLAVLTFFTFTNVVLRYVFSSTIIFAEELCKYCLVVSGFFSIPCWIRRRSGLRVDVLVQTLPKKARVAVELFVQILMVVFFAFLFYNCILVTGAIADSGQVSASLRMPMKYLYYFVCAGFGLSAVRSAQVVVLSLPGKEGR